MRIAEFSVKNRQFTLVAFVALLAMGLYSILTIPRAEDPTFPIPIYPITAVYPGADPTDLEQLVVDPIEERVRALDGLIDVKTTIEDGLATIVPEFDVSVDADRKYDEVIREVNALRASLPPDLARLEVIRVNATDVNIAQFALVSETAPWHELDKLARALRDDLARLPGVKDARTFGYPRREVRVALNAGKMAELGIPLTRVLQAIGGESVNIPGGSVDVGDRRFNVKTSGSYRDLESVRETVVGYGPGATVRVRDIGSVGWAYEEETSIVRFDGRRAVWVTASMQENQNIMQVRDRLWAAADAVESTLPANVTMHRPFDQSANVGLRLRRLGIDFLIAILLVLLTLLPLGFRASGIVMVSIPLSLAIGITLQKAAGYTINQLSIVGFVIALGLLVDDSIVVVENIARFLRQGYSRVEAAIAATQQIFVAVVGTTAALVFAFLPVLMLPGTPGKFIRSMPAAVVFTILASLVVSLTVIPFLASVFLKEEKDEHGNVFLRGLNRAIDLTYGRWLHLALARPVATLVIATGLFIGAVALVPRIGFSLFPKAGTPQFLVAVTAPDGSALSVTDSAVAFAERTLAERAQVRHVYANIGRGNPKIYYNVNSQSERTTYGELFVLIHEYDATDTPALLDSLRQTFDRYAAARIEVKEFENGPPIDAPIEIRVTGPDLDSLRAIAERVETVVSAEPGTRDVVNPLRVSRTDLRIVLDRAKAGLYGVPTAEIDRTVRFGLAGLPAGRFRDQDGEEYNVALRLPGATRKGVDALDHLWVGAVTGAQVPLRQLARTSFESSPPVIQHYDGERAVTIRSQVATGFNTDRVTRGILERLERLALPTGYRLEAAGEIASRQQSFGGLGAAILIATFGILAILVLEFRTFRGMLIVSSVIPLGVIGGLIALFLTGYTLSFTAAIGFVALIGIEIKNSILLVDFTNQLRAAGVEMREAIEQAGKVRFVPIVLTSATAIGGLTPLAIQGSSLYSPLAVVIIGGLVSSTLLSRLVTPVLYELLAPEVPTE